MVKGELSSGCPESLCSPCWATLWTFLGTFCSLDIIPLLNVLNKRAPKMSRSYYLPPGLKPYFRIIWYIYLKKKKKTKTNFPATPLLKIISLLIGECQKCMSLTNVSPSDCDAIRGPLQKGQQLHRQARLGCLWLLACHLEGQTGQWKILSNVVHGR